MDSYMISGIQQIGVGTEDFRKSWNWYIEMFGIDVKILEDDTVAERMLPYTGGKPQQRHACMHSCKPPGRRRIRDLAVFKAQARTLSVHHIRGRSWNICSKTQLL